MATLTHPRYIPSSTRILDRTSALTPELPRRIRAKRGDGERLRFEILDAVDTLLTSGAKDDGVSIRAVAELVGCTPPAIYLHFFDKQELLFEVCARRFKLLREHIDAAASNIADPLASLEAGMRAYISFGLSHPEHYRFLFMGTTTLTADQQEELRETGVTGLARLIDRCRRCVDGGAVAVPDAATMAFSLWSMAHGIVSLMIAKPQVEWPAVDAMVDHLLGSYLAGIRATPGMAAA